MRLSQASFCCGELAEAPAGPPSAACSSGITGKKRKAEKVEQNEHELLRPRQLLLMDDVADLPFYRHDDQDCYCIDSREMEEMTCVVSVAAYVVNHTRRGFVPPYEDRHGYVDFGTFNDPWGILAEDFFCGNMDDSRKWNEVFGYCRNVTEATFVMAGLYLNQLMDWIHTSPEPCLVTLFDKFKRAVRLLRAGHKKEWMAVKQLVDHLGFSPSSFAE